MNLLKNSRTAFSMLILTASTYSLANPTSLYTTDSVDIGFQIYDYSYEEEVDGALFMSNKGNKYGISGSWTENIDYSYYLKIDARYATGDVKYSSASGTGDVSDNVFETRGIVGTESVVEDYLLGSYIGVGYRFLENDLRDLGAGGYLRESEYVYIPIGITHRFHVNNISRISSSLEYDYLIEGTQKSYLSATGLFPDQTNKQKNGYGLRFNMAYEEPSWAIGAFINYWNIEDSEKNFVPPVIIYEPKNITKEIGLELKYRF